jgi:hypothetical protein
LTDVPPAREKETRELIERFKAKRKRRRILRIMYALLGGALVLAFVVAAVILVTREPGGEVDTNLTPAPSSTSTTVTTSAAAQVQATTSSGAIDHYHYAHYQHHRRSRNHAARDHIDHSHHPRHFQHDPSSGRGVGSLYRPRTSGTG